MLVMLSFSLLVTEGIFRQVDNSLVLFYLIDAQLV